MSGSKGHVIKALFVLNEWNLLTSFQEGLHDMQGVSYL